MTRTLGLTTAVTACALLSLGACTGGDADAAKPQAPEPDASPASQALTISTQSLSDTRTTPAEDQLITCEHTGDIGNTTTWSVAIKDGAVLSYSQMQNTAKAMCDPAQPSCALGWQGEKVGSYFKTQSGALNQHLLDLDSMTMERALTTDERGLEVTKYTCTSSSFPEGIQFD